MPLKYEFNSNKNTSRTSKQKQGPKIGFTLTKIFEKGDDDSQVPDDKKYKPDEFDLQETKQYFIERGINLQVQFYVDSDYFKLVQKEPKRKIKAVRKTKSLKTRIVTPANTEDNPQFAENKFVAPIPNVIPTDHPVQLGWTLSFESFYFVVLVNNSRNALIVKIVNPGTDPTFFHILMEIPKPDGETSTIFCDEDFKFDQINQERQHFLDPTIIKLVDTGAPISILISESRK